MTDTVDGDFASTEQTLFRALLMYRGGDWHRKANNAAEGRPTNDPVAALEALLLVTATALEKYQGRLCTKSEVPVVVADGSVDWNLIERGTRTRTAETSVGRRGIH